MTLFLSPAVEGTLTGFQDDAGCAIFGQNSHCYEILSPSPENFAKWGGWLQNEVARQGKATPWFSQFQRHLSQGLRWYSYMVYSPPLPNVSWELCQVITKWSCRARKGNAMILTISASSFSGIEMVFLLQSISTVTNEDFGNFCNDTALKIIVIILIL